jgi:hypothetical protein
MVGGIENEGESMPRTRKSHPPSLKAKVAVEAIKAHKTALDNVFIERLWRSLKYELVYPSDFASGADLFQALDRYFRFYNYRRPHQALGYRTPADLFPHRSIRKGSSP